MRQSFCILTHPNAWFQTIRAPFQHVNQFLSGGFLAKAAVNAVKAIIKPAAKALTKPLAKKVAKKVAKEMAKVDTIYGTQVPNEEYLHLNSSLL